MFANSKNFLNGGDSGGRRDSYSTNWSRNGNGRYFSRHEYEEEEMLNDYNGQIGESSFKIDTKALSVIGIVAVVGAAVYIFLQSPMEEVYIDWLVYIFNCIYQVSKYILEIIINFIQTQLTHIWEFITDEQIQNQLKPFICGLVVSYFSWMMVYMDSQVPGLNPPSPFSPKSKNRFRDQKETSTYIGYVIAVASGMIVTGLMLGYKNEQLANLIYVQ